MKRREFLQAMPVAGAAIGLAGQAESTEQQTVPVRAGNSSKSSFGDIGWVWEGQGIDPGVPPSIYGLGQGARYFGLSRANFLFHPNDVHSLRLLQDYDEVTCDISKWGWEWNEDGRPACKPKGDPVTVRTEGENVARLSREFPNITGVYCDDLLGLMKQFNYSPKEFGSIRSAIRRQGLRLTLWIWKSEDIVHMPQYVDQCRELFPDKPIIMGVYLRDYTKVAPIPVDLIKSQMEGIADLVEKGKLSGYSILAAVLIDGHRPQADAVRDFITAQS